MPMIDFYYEQHLTSEPLEGKESVIVVFSHPGCYQPSASIGSTCNTCSPDSRKPIRSTFCCQSGATRKQYSEYRVRHMTQRNSQYREMQGPQEKFSLHHETKKASSWRCARHVQSTPQPHPKSYQKRTFSGATPYLGDQNLWAGGLAIGFNSPPGNSDVCWSLRSTVLQYSFKAELGIVRRRGKVALISQEVLKIFYYVQNPEIWGTLINRRASR